MRAWIATHDDGIYWPDEIYQSLEPAHRLVYGTGIQAWEFIHGARNWLFPGLLAGLLKVAAIAGITHPRAYMIVIKVFFSGLAIVTAVGIHRLARAWDARPLAAAIGGSLFALAAPAIYFGPRALSENGSAPLVAFGLALALDRRSRTRSVALGAALVGLSAFFRLQNLLFCAGLLAVLLARRNWQAARLAAGVMTSCAAAFGLLDLVTWGSPFHSAVTYVADVSSASNRAVSSVSPFDYYFRYSLSAFGPLLLVVVPLSLLGARRAAGLLFIAVVYLLVHSLAGHKEYRVMIPLMPVVSALAAVGLDVMYRGISSRAVMRTAVAVTVALATISALTYRHLTFGDLGAYLGTRPQLSAYDDSGSVNRLMLVAHDRHDLCGLKVESIRILWSGGYTYLSRSVPIYPATGPGDDSGQYNYVITTDPPAEGRTEVATDGGQSLDRLSTDGCRPGPID